MSSNNGSGCPFTGGAVTSMGVLSNRDWWPNQLNLKILHQNSPQLDPMGKEFNYAEAFNTVDLNALRQDIFDLMTTSQDWSPCSWYQSSRWRPAGLSRR